MKNTKPDLNNIVAKDNQLIGQMAKYQLSELRLIAYCLAHYDSRKADNRTIEASVNDLQEIFKMTTKDAYAVVRQAVRAVNRKPIELETHRTEEEWYIFTGFRYYKNEGRFEFKISPEAQPLLLELGGNFTRYRLQDVYQFKAASTWKLYELLKRWLAKKEWDIELDELRMLMGVAGKYPRWSDFAKRIIRPAIKEINELSDLKVNYEKIKRGRRVVGVYFEIDKKTPAKEGAIDVKTVEQELCMELKKAGIHKKTAETYAKCVETAGRTKSILGKLPQMIQRAEKKGGQKYILGAIQSELNRGELFVPPAQQKRERERMKNLVATIDIESLKNLAEAGNVFAQRQLKNRMSGEQNVSSSTS